MKVAIDIDENIFTKLFNNGIEDYEISNDDLSAIATAIRGGIQLDECGGRLISVNDLSNRIMAGTLGLGSLGIAIADIFEDIVSDTPTKLNYAWFQNGKESN